MMYRLESFYQPQNGMPHIKVEPGKLSEYVGWTLADRIIRKASDRMMFRTTPEVNAFFGHGGRQVILADLTSRGNVYIEAVEVAE